MRAFRVHPSKWNSTAVHELEDNNLHQSDLQKYFLSFTLYTNYQGVLFNVVSDWGGSVCGLRFHISYMQAGDADATGPWTTLTTNDGYVQWNPTWARAVSLLPFPVISTSDVTSTILSAWSVFLPLLPTNGLFWNKIRCCIISL